MDIHNYKRIFERYIERINESNEISKENKIIILNFKNHCLSENIGVARISRYLGDLMKYSQMLKKPFDKATKEDIRRIIADLNQTELSEESKKCFKILIRKLYRFLRGIEEKGVFPDEVKWISINIPHNHKKLPEELLKEDEIKKIIEKCTNIRDRALISTLAESGARISEIGTMKIKHISFEEYGARLTITGKTGMRKILVINSTPYIKEYLNHHPDNSNPESYLWVRNDGGILSYARMTAILKNAARLAGIKKRIYCHLLRHSRATILASYMPEASMKQYLGWDQSSRMCGVYIHMNGEMTDKSILKANGIEVNKENIKPVMQPRDCIRCKTQNEATNIFCKKCGLSLNIEEARGIIKAETEREIADNIMNRLINDPEVLELIRKKLNS